ncbi:MAG: 30S ribosomal protein S12 methylthiotransferase RimO, partial [Acidimicrobiia bacterium]|nr:30S ribosomal protein S12 methylthiotransferase RimO [Acidimicrobiia bacterium]
MSGQQQRFYIETLGCPKNQVDSDKLIGTLLADGMVAVQSAEEADLVVVNTCAFIDEARRESIDTILSLDEQRPASSRLVVTGCMAERYGAELAAELPEVDMVAGFGVPVQQAAARKLIPVGSAPVPTLDLLNLPRPKSSSPWAYVKIAEGCDRSCGFCAIPSFRGPQRSRDVDSILREVDELQAREIVLIAQDLASYGKDRPEELGAGSIVSLVRRVSAMVDRTRLLYLYPSDLSDGLIDAILDTGVPYFDLSLQHVSKTLLRRMRRWGDGSRFLDRIEDIRRREPDAAFRSNFIVGYPGETESDHDQLLDFVESAQLDWCGFFAYSPEEGTYAVDLDGAVPDSLVRERLAELSELQDSITARRRDDLIGREICARHWVRTLRPTDELAKSALTDRMWHDDVVPVDPNAIATWANAVTVGRILVSPLMFVVIPDSAGGSWVAFALWFVLCSSDGIDGYLARRHG